MYQKLKLITNSKQLLYAIRMKMLAPLLDSPASSTISTKVLLKNIPAAGRRKK